MSNSEFAIERAKPVAEEFRGALTAAVEGTGRSADLQVGYLTGYIAAAIDAALRDVRDQELVDIKVYSHTNFDGPYYLSEEDLRKAWTALTDNVLGAAG